MSQSTDQERIQRLERTVFWLKMGLIVLIVGLVALAIPPVAAILGAILFVVVVGGGMIVFITSIICLLDRVFPASKPKA